MKQNKLKKKLSLNKNTISSLQMEFVTGGCPVCTCPCPECSCAPCDTFAFTCFVPECVTQDPDCPTKIGCSGKFTCDPRDCGM